MSTLLEVHERERGDRERAKSKKKSEVMTRLSGARWPLHETIHFRGGQTGQSLVDWPTGRPIRPTQLILQRRLDGPVTGIYTCTPHTHTCEHIRILLDAIGKKNLDFFPIALIVGTSEWTAGGEKKKRVGGRRSGLHLAKAPPPRCGCLRTVLCACTKVLETAACGASGRKGAGHE